MILVAREALPRVVHPSHRIEVRSQIVALTNPPRCERIVGKRCVGLEAEQTPADSPILRIAIEIRHREIVERVDSARDHIKFSREKTLLDREMVKADGLAPVDLLNREEIRDGVRGAAPLPLHHRGKKKGFPKARQSLQIEKCGNRGCPRIANRPHLARGRIRRNLVFIGTDYRDSRVVEAMPQSSPIAAERIRLRPSPRVIKILEVEQAPPLPEFLVRHAHPRCSFGKAQTLAKKQDRDDPKNDSATHGGGKRRLILCSGRNAYSNGGVNAV